VIYIQACARLIFIKHEHALVESGQVGRRYIDVKYFDTHLNLNVSIYILQHNIQGEPECKYINTHIYICIPIYIVLHYNILARLIDQHGHALVEPGQVRRCYIYVNYLDTHLNVHVSIYILQYNIMGEPKFIYINTQIYICISLYI